MTILKLSSQHFKLISNSGRAHCRTSCFLDFSLLAVTQGSRTFLFCGSTCAFHWLQQGKRAGGSWVSPYTLWTEVTHVTSAHSPLAPPNCRGWGCLEKLWCQTFSHSTVSHIYLIICLFPLNSSIMARICDSFVSCCMPRAKYIYQSEHLWGIWMGEWMNDGLMACGSR